MCSENMKKKTIFLISFYYFYYFEESKYDLDKSVQFKRGISVLEDSKTEHGMHLHKGQAQDSLGLYHYTALGPSQNFIFPI